MVRTKYSILVLFILGIFFTGFQCASTELTSAKLYIQQKNFDKALDVLKKEVEKNPGSDEGWYLLGVVYGDKENFTDMTNAYSRSLAISNKFQKEISASKKYHWANLFNKGVAFFQKAAKVTDKDSTKFYYQKSAAAYSEAIKVEPDSGTTYRNLAFSYLALGENDKAVEPLQTLINKNGSLDGYKYLGEVLYSQASGLRNDYLKSKNVQDSVKAQELFEKDIKLLKEARAKYPDDTELLATLSNAYVGAGQLSVAVDAFKAGVEKEPENKYYRYNYGVVLLGADKFEEAANQFKKAIDIDPKYENAIYNLAVTYVKWGSFINKKAEDDKSVTNDYKDKYKLALPYLKQVAESKKSDIPTWELLGKVYSVLGMQTEAKSAFDTVDQLRKSK